MSKPIVYLFVNVDLETSMSSGRACAQMSHATSILHKVGESGRLNTRVQALYDKWCDETPYGFGTVEVRAMTYKQIQASLGFATGMETIFVAPVIDPEYYIRLSDTLFRGENVLTGMVMLGDFEQPTAVNDYFNRFPRLGADGDLNYFYQELMNENESS